MCDPVSRRHDGFVDALHGGGWGYTQKQESWLASGVCLVSVYIWIHIILNFSFDRIYSKIVAWMTGS